MTPQTPISRRQMTPLGQARGRARNGLLNNLVLYSAGNEESGDRLDLHTNALHLTDVNTVTSNTGLVYPLARQYTAAQNEYHTRPGDDALLSIDAINQDFSIAVWVKFTSFPNAFNDIVTKMGAIGQYAYIVGYRCAPVNRLRMLVSHDGTNTVIVYANSFGAPVPGVWNFIAAWHDSIADTINIQINNGVVDTLPHATGIFDNTASFRIGARDGMVAPPVNLDGIVGPTTLWKSAPGGGGVLTAAQRTALYNGGAGLTYAQFTT